MLGQCGYSRTGIGKAAGWLLLAAVLASAASAGDNDLYIVDEVGVLGIVDVQTGKATVIGATGTVLTDIAFDPQGRLFGLTETQFYRIDPATGTATELGAHGLPQASALVAGPDGTLLAAGSNTLWLYSIDPNSAIATPRDYVGHGALGDIAFFDGDLYMAAANRMLIRLDPAGDNAANGIGSFGGLNLYGMDTVGGILCGAAGTCLYALDTTSGVATLLVDYAGQGLGPAWGATAGPPTSDLPPRPGFGPYYEPYEPNIVPNAPGYTLPLDIDTITNFAQIDAIVDLDGVTDLIRQNGFAVIEPDARLRAFLETDDDIIEPYSALRARDIPLFFTTDTMLHLYHVQFDETLRDIEERCFVADIDGLTAALLDDAVSLHAQLQGDLKEAAGRNLAYLSVARRLMDPNAPIPALAASAAARELANIEAHEGFVPSDIFIYKEDYSQYVPRGHYTRSDALKRYFKTLMWYGRMAFLLKGSDPWGTFGQALISVHDAKVQTLQALLLTTSLRTVHVGERTALEVWDRLYGVTAFYVGLADDLTPYDYLWALDQVFDSDFALDDLADEDNYLALKRELALLPKPKIYGGTGNIILSPIAPPEALDEVLDKTAGLRLMGQRFIPDSYMFQHLVFPQVGAYLGNPAEPPFTMSKDGIRGYPRGLDVMAMLGSERARTILVDEGDTNYVDYWQRFAELEEQFAALTETDWHANLYWSWLHTLRALLEAPPEGYPNFMRAEAWQRHQLHSTLASWTELRHDTILYAKQSYTPGRGGTLAPPAYVEPVAQFWSRLLALARMTSRGLDDLGVLSAEARQRLHETEDSITQLLAITGRQLANEPLSASDTAFIAGLVLRLDGIVAGVHDTGVKTTLVADVHTEAGDGLVLEEAVGKVDLIVVACPAPDGSIFLAVGPVLSYYEFKQPMSDRLTDEAWRNLLDSPERPDRPTWYRPLLHTN